MEMENERQMSLSAVQMPDSPSGEAHLVLADGMVLSGVGFGHRGTAVGEVVFNTGMTGYQAGSYTHLTLPTILRV